MKSLKKVFYILMLAVISLVFHVPFQNAKASDLVNVTVHYHRFKGDYTSWNLWTWAGSGDGKVQNAQSIDDYGQVYNFDIDVGEATPDNKGIGFICRKGEWLEKDVGEDRFIPLSKIVDNSVTIYLVSDDPTIYYSLEDVDLTPKFTFATFTNNTTIKASTNTVLDTNILNEITVSDGLNNVEIASKGKLNDFELRLVLSTPMTISKTYTVTHSILGTIEVAKTGLFSTPEFDNEYAYSGDDLGVTYSKTSSTFKLWTPFAKNVILNIYEAGNGGSILTSYPLTLGAKGVFSTVVNGDLNNKYYTYSVTHGNSTYEIVDPYAVSGGVNGNRGMILDLSTTNPEGFANDVSPVLENKQDAIIYETHVREFTIDSSSGVTTKNAGKYLGLTEKGTVNSFNEKTGLDHLLDLGITDLHLQPIFDFASVDESHLETPQFNWGYDPKNYNFPDGSYSSNPFDGKTRVNELKEMVQTLHENGIRVVMDVVYNHTFTSSDSFLNQLFPNYFYRFTADGKWANGSGCGNETASENSMFRKYMIDTLLNWTKEYHIDGFRFDLMGLHDIETMNLISAKLKEVNPDVLLYGEGWTAGGSVLPADKQSVMANARQLPDYAMFNDKIRDAVKGSTEGTDGGFVQGVSGKVDGVKSGIVGGVSHAQVTTPRWTSSTASSVNYVSSHDNLTLRDKIDRSYPLGSPTERKNAQLQAASIYLTAQGIPFFNGGEEIMRSKPLIGGGVSGNSYNLPDYTNSFKWDTKHDYLDVYDFYKNLISIRKEFPILRSSDFSSIELHFFETNNDLQIAYTYNEIIEGYKYEMVYIVNSSSSDFNFNSPINNMEVYVENNIANPLGIRTSGKEISVKGKTSTLLIKKTVVESPTSEVPPTSETEKSAGCKKGNNGGVALISIATVISLVFFFVRKKD